MHSDLPSGRLSIKAVKLCWGACHCQESESLMYSMGVLKEVLFWKVRILAQCKIVHLGQFSKTVPLHVISGYIQDGNNIHPVPFTCYLCPYIPMYPIPRPCFYTIKPGSTTRPTTYETPDSGQQVSLLAPNLSDPNIHLALLYIFHLWWFFSIIIQPSIHLALPPPSFY